MRCRARLIVEYYVVENCARSICRVAKYTSRTPSFFHYHDEVSGNAQRGAPLSAGIRIGLVIANIVCVDLLLCCLFVVVLVTIILLMLGGQHNGHLLFWLPDSVKLIFRYVAFLAC